MHGHSYVLEVQVTGEVQKSGPERGMVLDFGRIDAAFASLSGTVDHSTLNETLHVNPTVENMAPEIWRHFDDALACVPPLMVRVWLWEGPRSGAMYPPEAL